jgi:hypothetical protein
MVRPFGGGATGERTSGGWTVGKIILLLLEGKELKGATVEGIPVDRVETETSGQ